MRRPLPTRPLAFAASAATATLALTTVGLAVPAVATSSALEYTCTVVEIAGGDAAFTVVDGTAPTTTVYAGQHVKLSSRITFPDTMASSLKGIAPYFDGTVAADLSLNGTFREQSLTMPKTALPSSGPGTVTATGILVAPTRPGRLKLTAGDFTAVFTGRTANGAAVPYPTTTGVVTLKCVAPADTDTTVGDLLVKRDSTRSALAASRKARRIVAAVAVKATHGAATAGKVTVLVKKGRRTVEKKAATLKAGKVTVKLPKKLKKGKYVVTATYAGTPGLKASTVKHTIKVG